MYLSNPHAELTLSHQKLAAYQQAAYEARVRSAARAARPARQVPGRRLAAIALPLIAAVSAVLGVGTALADDGDGSSAPAGCERADGEYAIGCRLTPGAADGWFRSK